MASPVRAKKHGKPHSRIMGWLVAYEAATPGVETLDNTTVRLDADNEPQPDAVLRLEQGGQSTISDEWNGIENWHLGSAKTLDMP